MATWLAVAVAGALGAVARYEVDGLVSARFTSFPYGTLAVNLSGCFLLGLLFTLFTEHLHVATWIRSGATIGFLGAYTTFSTFSLESFRLAEDGAVGLALANVGASVGLGLVAVYAGVVLGRAL